jgi:hypothetical protein
VAMACCIGCWVHCWLVDMSGVHVIMVMIGDGRRNSAGRESENGSRSMGAGDRDAGTSASVGIVGASAVCSTCINGDMSWSWP